MPKLNFIFICLGISLVCDLAHATLPVELNGKVVTPCFYTLRFGGMTDEKVGELSADYGDSDAQSYLIYKYTPMVRKQTARSIDSGDDLFDIQSTAFKGLLKATETFEIERGNKFITHAMGCVLRAVRARKSRGGVWARTSTNSMRTKADGSYVDFWAQLPDRRPLDTNVDDLDLSKEVESLLSSLDEEEQWVIRERYFSGEPLTYDELGLMKEVSFQTIINLEARAIAKLKRLVVTRADVLANALDFESGFAQTFVAALRIKSNSTKTYFDLEPEERTAFLVSRREELGVDIDLLVKTIMGNLDANARKVVSEKIGLHGEPQSIAEVARRMRGNPASVRSMYLRGMDKIRQQIADHQETFRPLIVREASDD